MSGARAERGALALGALVFALASVFTLTLAQPSVAADPRPEGEAGAERLSAATIDAALAAHWKTKGLEPAPELDPAADLRRLSLDLRGTIPSASEVEAYLGDRRADKRERLVEGFLSSARRGTHVARWASDAWIGPLDDLPQARPYLSGLRGWIADAVRADRPWVQVAMRLVAAEGNAVEDPTLLYAVRYRESTEDYAGAVARDFLGLSLECARCHDHPFDDWTQADFHGLAASFARVRFRRKGGAELRLQEAPLGEHAFEDPSGKRYAPAVSYPVRPGAARKTPAGSPQQAPARERRAPKPGSRMAERAVERPAQGATSRPTSRPSFKDPLARTTQTSRRAALARWIAQPDNPWFARNTVNRTWERFFGAPLVGEDLAGAAESPHAELLDALARSFVASNFSLRTLERAIVRSRAYRCASAPLQDSAKPKRAPSDASLEAARAAFALARVRPLSAPVLVGALLEAGGRGAARADALPRVYERLRERLISDYRRVQPERARVGEAGPGEALWWLNGRAALGLSRGVALRAALTLPTAKARVRSLFVRSLGRPPRPHEQRAALAHVGRGADAERYADLFWALLATSEFGTNH